LALLVQREQWDGQKHPESPFIGVRPRPVEVFVVTSTEPAKGRTIRLFLVDGAPTGILTAEIMNWTGKVVVAPRSRLPDLIVRPEARRTGVYFLVGPDPEDALRTMIYIGESDSVRERLVQHNADDTKDFFTRVCLVVSKDENLTKTHVRYLESRLIGLIKVANRAKLTNGTAPAFDLLPESDRADMEFFIEQIGIILPVLGLDFTQPPPIPAPESKQSGDTAPQPQFEISTVGVKADAIEVDGEFVVLKGSQARLGGRMSWTSYKGLRDKLLVDKKLIESEQDGILTFAENVSFGSPSAAATVICAGNTNGRIAWRVKGTGQTYKDWQDSEIAITARLGA
jgi:hypothetical protein